ncbi:MAG: DUF1326 domain-containing protein [Alphaproteobacteria bacterium]|jgi:hypothetical protein|nr:DUF1326 domain-containing protein [Alphaproteobacteria bacterium]
MATVDWRVEGPHFINCNCDYGCPCQFMALPTDGTCKAVWAIRIDKGHFGETRLDGLIAANTYDWPGPIHEGNGTMQTIIDARADADQRAAIAAVMQGEGSEPGSSMLKIYRDMCPNQHEPVFATIELEIDMGRRSARFVVPDLVETSVEPLRNRVSGAEHRARIDLPMGKEFLIAEVASGSTKATGAIPLEFADSHAHFADSTFTTGGLAT